MPLRSAMFTPVDGELHGHLFENTSIGLKRDLFWSIYVSFAEFEHQDFEHESNCMADWLFFPSPDRLNDTTQPILAETQHMAEVSCYIHNHHIPSENWKFHLTPLSEKPGWILDYDVLVQSAHLEEDDDQDLRLAGSVELSFGGIVIVKSTFSPKGLSANDAVSLLSDYMPNADRMECVDEDWRFVFH